MFKRINQWLAALFEDDTYDAFRPMIIAHITDGLNYPTYHTLTPIRKCKIMKDSDYIGYIPFEREIRFTEM